jgi:flagellar biosynthesis chaperone FliJ
MERGNKLTSLLRSREADEHEALQERMRVFKIFDDRLKALQEVEADCDRIRLQLKELESSGRRQALQSGDVRQVASVNDFSGVLRKKLAQLQGLLAERTEDFEKAKTRASLAEEDLVKARVERKKVETLIASQEKSKRIVDAALDESAQDEYSSQRHK